LRYGEPIVLAFGLLVELNKGGIMKGYLFGLGAMLVGEVKSG